MYIMAPEPINDVLHKSFSSVWVSVCVSLLSLLGKNLVNTFPRQRIHATMQELWDACADGSITISLLGNNVVKTFPRQRTHATIQELWGQCVWVSVYRRIIAR
jgi:hypothetical protein